MGASVRQATEIASRNCVRIQLPQEDVWRNKTQDALSVAFQYLQALVSVITDCWREMFYRRAGCNSLPRSPGVTACVVTSHLYTRGENPKSNRRTELGKNEGLAEPNV